MQLFLLNIAFQWIHFHNQVNGIIHCFPNLSDCEEQDKCEFGVLQILKFGASFTPSWEGSVQSDSETNLKTLIVQSSLI